jgi:hypothetical protein
MKKSSLMLAILAAGIVFAAAPALALTWTCTAKNLRGMTFTRTAVGAFSGPVYARARSKALYACDPASAVCVITSCAKN